MTRSGSWVAVFYDDDGPYAARGPFNAKSEAVAAGEVARTTDRFEAVELLELDASDLHFAGIKRPRRRNLRDDAPYLVCSDCGRKSWGSVEGEHCLMPQPDGTTCLGSFVAPNSEAGNTNTSPEPAE